MSIKTLSSALLAATCVLALGACAHSSSAPSQTPTSAPEPTATQSASPTEEEPTTDTDLAAMTTQPMRGLIIEESRRDDTVLRALDPATGTTVAARIFPDDDALTPTLNGCPYNRCYSHDYSYMIMRQSHTDEQLIYHVGYLDTKGTFTDVSAMIPVDPGYSFVDDEAYSFSADGYFYMRRNYTQTEGNTSRYYRLKPGDKAPELVKETSPSDSNEHAFNLLAGTTLTTNTALQFTRTIDNTVYCWHPGDAISSTNTCYRLTRDKGLFSYPATAEPDYTTPAPETTIFKPTEFSVPEFDTMPLISPDDKQIAFMMAPDKNSPFALHVMNVDGSGERTITPDTHPFNRILPIAWRS